VNSKKNFHKAAQRAISFHSFDLELWLLIIFFELEQMRNPFKARKLFLKAIKINKHKLEYLRAYFAFEVKVFELICKRK